MIYITSDLHFAHDKPFLYEPRGFSSPEEHCETIIENWNSIIKPEDEVYILGDLVLTNTESGVEYLKKLSGKKYFIIGNHENQRRIELYCKEAGLICCGYSTLLKYRKYHFYLSHFPALTSNYDVDKPLKTRTICLCGHTHTKDKFQDMNLGIIYHVELDAHNNFPVSLDNIIEDIKTYLGPIT